MKYVLIHGPEGNWPERYIELFESITGESFVKVDNKEVQNRIEENILKFIKEL